MWKQPHLQNTSKWFFSLHVCIGVGWAVRWWGALSWRPNEGAGGPICHLLHHCVRMVSHHLLSLKVIPTHTHTHTRLKETDKISFSSAKTWRPRPWDHDHACDHTAAEQRSAPAASWPRSAHPQPFKRAYLNTALEKPNDNANNNPLPFIWPSVLCLQIIRAGCGRMLCLWVYGCVPPQCHYTNRWEAQWVNRSTRNPLVPI